MNKKDEIIPQNIFNFITILIIGAGLVLRLRAYLTDRSLWLDEAMLALNIINRSFSGLFQQPMEYGQSSPIGYVISVKAITQIFGDSEYALRLFSLMTGSLALILMGPIAGRVLGRAGGIMALALFAFNPNLIYYSSEVKQYIGDVLAVTCIFLVFLLLLNPGETTRRYIALGATGTILLWFSHPLVFVLAGIGITLFLHTAGSAEQRPDMYKLLICGISWGISAMALYFIHFRHLASSNLLLDYWQGGFMPMPPWSDMGWFGRTWQGMLADPLSIKVQPLFLFGISILGLVYLFQKEWQIGSVIAITCGLALAASGIGAYPLAGRLLLFSVPFFVLVLSAGIIKGTSWIKNKKLSLWVQVFLVMYLLWMPFRSSMENFINPTYYEHIKPYMEYLHDSKKENDLVYVYYAAGPAFRFYSPKFRLDNLEYVIGNDHSKEPDAYYNELDQLRGRKRVWLLFSHIYEDDTHNDKETMLVYADQVGKKSANSGYRLHPLTYICMILNEAGHRSAVAHKLR